MGDSGSGGALKAAGGRPVGREGGREGEDRVESVGYKGDVMTEEEGEEEELKQGLIK